MAEISTVLKFNIQLLNSKAIQVPLRRQSQATEEFIETQSSQQTVQKRTQSKSVEQTTYKAQHTAKKQTNSRDDLEERLAEQGPQRVELLLCMRHVCDPLAAVLDRVHHKLAQLLDLLGESSTDGSVAFLKDLAALFDQRLKTVKSLSDDTSHLLRQIPVLVGLLLGLHLLLGWSCFRFHFRFLFLLLRQVLEQGTLAQLVSIIVDNIAVVVDHLPDEGWQIARCQFTNEVTVSVADLALFVDLSAGHGVDITLLLFWLPAFSLSDGVTILVEDVSIFVDLTTKESFGIAFNDTTDDAAASHDDTVFANFRIVEPLCSADDFSIITPDLTLAVHLSASKALTISGNDTSEDIALRVDDVASLVDRLSLQNRQIRLLFLFLFRLVRVCVSFDVAELVDDISVFIDGAAAELLGIALGHFADNVAFIILDEAFLIDDKVVKAGKHAFGLLFTLFFGDELHASNGLAAIPDLAIINLFTGQLFWIPLYHTGNGHTVWTNNKSQLVRLQAIQLRKIRFLSLRLVGGFVVLSLCDHITVLVSDITIFVDRTSKKLLRVSFNDLADSLAILVFDPAILNDMETFQASEGRLALVILNRKGLCLADNVATIVPELALVVQLSSHAGDLLWIAFDKLTDWLASWWQLFLSFFLSVVDCGLGFLGRAIKVLLLDAFNCLLGDFLLGALVFRSQLLGVIRPVCGVLGFSRYDFSAADGVAILIQDLAFVVQIVADKVLRVALGNLCNDLAGLVFNDAPFRHRKAIQVGEVAVFVDDFSFLVHRIANKILGISLGDFADGLAVLILDESFFRDGKTVEVGEISHSILGLFGRFVGLVLGLISGLFDLVLGLISSLVCGVLRLRGNILSLFWSILRLVGEILGSVRQKLHATDKITVFVKDLSIITHFLANKILRLAFHDSSQWVAILAEDLATFTDLEAL
ncbi:hypothetical protein IFM46972_05599 [Aspergillus udagawae]|uniref:Uncharacterized protein n=1 Tax=Aspergillus udagawae TaxID=91492 RepID=A0A8H3NU22_9EURO|nr:hypothetical protein IFM46972_05599 [Aspergillus udagawae]